MSQELERLEYLITSVAPNELEKVRYRGERDEMCVLLYASIVETAHAAVALISASYGRTSRILLRTVLEGYIDLKNLVADETFLRVLEFEHAKHLRLIGENALAGSPYFGSIASHPGFPEMHTQNLKKFSELRPDAKPRASREKRFEAALESSVYQSTYRDLCDHSHNGIMALRSKHFEFDGGKKSKLKLFSGQSPEESYLESQLCFNLVKSSSIELHTHFSSGSEGIFQELSIDDDSVFDLPGA